MKTLILSDIHANEPALLSVLRDADDCEKIIFLGDLANFGPHPSECVDLLMKYDPICIMGNHDEEIISDNPRNIWDKWSKQQLRQDQLKWMSEFKSSHILDGHVLIVHGSYSVDYDILPNTPDEDIKKAFEHLLTPQIDQVWFGHYHYQVDRTVDGVEYHCIRPVGHHRDKDTRASYYIYKDGVLTQKRVEYELSKTIEGFNKIDVFEDIERKKQYVDFLKNAFHEQLLIKDLKQMEINEQKAQSPKNKKVTVKNSEGEIRYCILLGGKDLREQFNSWYFGCGQPSSGMTIRFDGSQLSVVDYYYNETRASFDVISIEDTNEDVALCWIDPKTNKTGWE